MNKGTKVLTALIVGLAAGAVAGLLMAPRKGSETRKLIRTKSNDVAENIMGTVEEGKNKINVLKDNFRDKIVGLNKKVDEFS